MEHMSKRICSFIGVSNNPIGYLVFPPSMINPPFCNSLFFFVKENREGTLSVFGKGKEVEGRLKGLTAASFGILL